jgi:hypothetical protein
MHTTFSLQTRMEEITLGPSVVDGRIILKLILKKHGVRMWIGFVWLKIAFTGGLCEHRNATLRSIKGSEFLDLLSDCQFINKNYAPCS